MAGKASGASGLRSRADLFSSGEARRVRAGLTKWRGASVSLTPAPYRASEQRIPEGDCSGLRLLRAPSVNGQHDAACDLPLCGVDDGATVMRAHGDRAGVGDRVQHADGEGFGQLCRYVLERHPGDITGFRRRLCGSVNNLAPKDQSHDTQRHVLVDARDSERFDGVAGFLKDLPTQAGMDVFVQLKNSAGCLPFAVVPPPNQKDSIVFVHDDG
jgi:hypothetical protein